VPEKDGARTIEIGPIRRIWSAQSKAGEAAVIIIAGGPLKAFCGKGRRRFSVGSDVNAGLSAFDRLF